MKFVRHLGAVTLVVAVVVVIGLAWNHFEPGTLVGGVQASFDKQASASGRAPGVAVLRPGAKTGGPHGPHGRVVIVRNGPMNLGLGSMFDPVNLAVLRHTVVIEAVVIAIVVMIDVSRRLWRQERRRARQLAPYRSDDEPDQ
ncbi:MAG TPA: hypothetical protein VMC03_17825 [Streptosporangiaceae bacterium]|nr:hypothetical protein [Streptosporangiaceae bacterium]